MRLPVATVAFLVGCGASTPPPSTPPSNTPAADAAGDTVIDHLRAYRDDMCACADAACTREVDRDMSKWHDRHRKELEGHHAATAAEHQLEDQLTSCQTKAKAAGPGTRDKMSAMLAEYTDKVCACKDTACAQQVSEEMQKWASENPDDTEEISSKPTPEQEEQIKRITECMTKLYSANPPSPPSPP
jgi:hypothetical protein